MSIFTGPVQYIDRYLFYCANLNNRTTKKDVKRHNAAMKQLSKLFHRVENEEDKSFFAELLQSKDNRTRALVAAHCLGLGIYVFEAQHILLALARNKREPILALEAQTTLEVWKQQGYLKF